MGPLLTTTLCMALSMKLMEGWLKRRAKDSGHCLVGCQGGTRGPHEEHRSVTPGAGAGFEGMEMVTHLKDDLSWHVEAGGRTAPWEEHLQLHHWQMFLWFLEPPCCSCSCCLCAPVQRNTGNIESRPDQEGMAVCCQWITNTDPSHGDFLEPDEL